jgi:cyclopropane fatty-acyl-phospholipid synthase-like methyltransferase
LQSDDYFEKHPCYDGLKDVFPGELNLIKSFMPLSPDMNVVVIGCGYGRETAHIAPLVRRVYGIDVSKIILDKAASYLSQRSISNFVPLLVDHYKDDIPDSNIDLIFSIVVMQHLTRDLVVDYFSTLSRKLKVGGSMLVQFLEEIDGPIKDAELRLYEPSVSWSIPEIAKLCQSCSLNFASRSIMATDIALWHWLHARRVGSR